MLRTGPTRATGPGCCLWFAVSSVQFSPSYSSLGHTDYSLLAIIVTFAVVITWLSVKSVYKIFQECCSVPEPDHPHYCHIQQGELSHAGWCANWNGVCSHKWYRSVPLSCSLHCQVGRVAKTACEDNVTCEENQETFEATPLLAPVDTHTPPQCQAVARSFVVLHEPMLTQPD